MELFNPDKYNDYPKPLRKNKGIFVFSMVIISIISFLVFYVGVNGQSILLAFQKYEGIRDGERVYSFTFDNFKKIFSELGNSSQNSTNLLLAIKNSLILFFCGTFISLPMGAIVSYYLWKKIPGNKVFKTVFYLPGIISSVVSVIVFKSMIAPNGFIGTIVVKLTGTPIPALLSQDGTAFWMVFVYNLWMGFVGPYILLYAALCRIPEDIVDSAKLDGANAFVEYIHICIPLIWPTLYIILIQKIAGILGGDGPILLLTGGAYNTMTIGYWNYHQVVLSGSYEYPAAVGLMMTLVVAPLALTANKLLSRVYQDVEF